MPKHDWIDSDKFEIRVKWTGPAIDPPPHEALLDGFPIEPPRGGGGWVFVSMRSSADQEGRDQYETLWIKPKKAVRKKRRKKIPEQAPVPVPVPVPEQEEASPQPVKPPRVRRTKAKVKRARKKPLRVRKPSSVTPIEPVAPVEEPEAPAQE